MDAEFDSIVVPGFGALVADQHVVGDRGGEVSRPGRHALRRSALRSAGAGLVSDPVMLDTLVRSRCVAGSAPIPTGGRRWWAGRRLARHR